MDEGKGEAKRKGTEEQQKRREGADAEEGQAEGARGTSGRHNWRRDLKGDGVGGRILCI